MKINTTIVVVVVDIRPSVKGPRSSEESMVPFWVWSTRKENIHILK